jgi:PAS domain S-box-containing protein
MQEKLKEYIEEEKFYKDVVEDGSDVIFVVDFDLNILYHNPSVQQTIGYSSLVGQSFIEYIHPKVKKAVIEAFEISKSHPYNSNIEFKFLCGDDTYKYLEFNSINLKFKDGIDGLILDCRDVSERKKDQEELINAQKTKEQFLANMSHEIRTPINGIAGMVNLLIASSLTSEQENYLNAIKHSADNLKVIINDILDFSVIESGQLKFEKIGFDIIYQIKSVIDSLMLQAQEKGLTIELNASPELNDMVLIGDPVRLNQILINLINNSIKFTNEGKITVDVTCARGMDKEVNVTFKVIDSGIGIPKEKVKTIFDTFKQADESITRKYGGTGLGLTISKQLVELQDGKISVESTLGKGTTFAVMIPYSEGSTYDILTREEPIRKNKDTTSANGLAGMRVLLVEDNDINRMYAATILKKWHCTIEDAENGQIALEKIRKKDFDVILMDIHMPILDGIEAARTIRTSMPEPKCNIPIVAFTANALKGDKNKYLEVGMNSYISKPFMPDELYTILAQFYVAKTNNKPNNNQLTDLTHLRKMSNNDESFMQDMIKAFCDNTPLILEQLEKSCKEKNWEEVGALAHKLKPNLAFMGISSLKDPILDIEHSGKNGEKTADLPVKVDSMIKNVQFAIKELQQNPI